MAPAAHLKCLRSQPMASQRLVLFPHAGAGASTYQRWPDFFSDDIELYALQLPGREERLEEEPFHEWGKMFATLKEALLTLPATPVSFYGHSLGAVIAFEAASFFAETFPSRLRHLFVSGRAWPGGNKEAPIHIPSLTDQTFLTFMENRFGNAGPAMANEEIRDMVLPVLRADVELLLSHQYHSTAKLPVPLSVFHGSTDPSTNDGNLAGWKSETASQCHFFEINGDHFFPVSHEEEVARLVARQLEARP